MLQWNRNNKQDAAMEQEQQRIDAATEQEQQTDGNEPRFLGWKRNNKFKSKPTKTRNRNIDMSKKTQKFRKKK